MALFVLSCTKESPQCGTSCEIVSRFPALGLWICIWHVLACVCAFACVRACVCVVVVIAQMVRSMLTTPWRTDRAVKFLLTVNPPPWTALIWADYGSRNKGVLRSDRGRGSGWGALTAWAAAASRPLAHLHEAPWSADLGSGFHRSCAALSAECNWS